MSRGGGVCPARQEAFKRGSGATWPSLSTWSTYFNKEANGHDAAECHYFGTVVNEIYEMSHGLLGEDVQTVAVSLRQVSASKPAIESTFS